MIFFLSLDAYFDTLDQLDTFRHAFKHTLKTFSTFKHDTLNLHDSFYHVFYLNVMPNKLINLKFIHLKHLKRKHRPLNSYKIRLNVIKILKLTNGRPLLAPTGCPYLDFHAKDIFTEND